MKGENLHVHHIVTTQVPRLVQDRVKLWMQVTMMANRNLLWTAAFIRIITTFYEVTLTCPVHVGAAEKLWRRSSPFFSSSENENRPRPAGFFSSTKTASFLQLFMINWLGFHSQTHIGLLVICWSSRWQNNAICLPLTRRCITRLSQRWSCSTTATQACSRCALVKYCTCITLVLQRHENHRSLPPTIIFPVFSYRVCPYLASFFILLNWSHHTRSWLLSWNQWSSSRATSSAGKMTSAERCT